MTKVSENIGCSGCPMAARYPEAAFVPAKLGTGLRLVVAEAPGEFETLAGEPLVGGSGKRFDAMCRAAGVGRESLTIINTIQCRPPQNIYPTDAPARSYIPLSEAEYAVDQCYRNHVLPVLRSKPWERVDLLGDKALRRLSPDSPHDGIMANRGFPVPIKDLGGKRIGMPTIHPAAVARDQIYTKVVIADLSKGLQIAPEKYNPFPSLEDVVNFKATTFAFDIENTIDTHEVYMVGLSAEPYKAMCVPFRGAYIPELRRIFSEARVVVGHNSLQHDEPILRENGVSLSASATHYDTMLMAGLLLPDLKHGLEFCASIFIPKTRWKYLKGDAEEVYNCRDVDITFQLWQQFLPMLKAEKLHDLYLDVQVPLAKLCKMMTDRGVRVEPGRVKELRDKFGDEVRRLDLLLPERLRSFDKAIKKRERAPEGTKSPKSGKVLKWVSVEATERVSPWRSSDEVAAYLYDELHLPKQLHVKSQQVTVDKTALEKLGRKLRTKAFEGHPQREEAIRAIETLSAIKKLATLLSSFATEELSAATSAHSHFRPDGTASGRLSSSDPNLQNQPEKVRFLYVPRNSDWTMVDVDYSGIEARLTAYLAGDTERLDKYLTIPDYSEHKQACEVFFDIPYCVTPDTLVLKRDLTWCKASSLKVNDSLIGFDEKLDGYTRGKGPVYKPSIVTQLANRKLPCYQITTDYGVVQASADHLWVVRKRRLSGNSNKYYGWARTAELTPFDEILHLGAPWEPDTCRDAGYISGFLDGEGSVSKQGVVGFAQKGGRVLDEVLRILEPNFTIGLDQDHVCHGRFQGEPLAGLRALGTFRPIRLLEKAEYIWNGSKIWGVGSNRAVVREVTYIGEQDTVAIQTSTATLIANGFLSHNSEVVKDNSKDAAYGKAKRIVHGTNYGLGARKLALMYDMQESEVRTLIAKWKAAIPKTTLWQERTAKEAEHNGVLTTPFGRKRWFWTDSVYTESLSFLPQSTAADVIFRAMIGLCFDRIGLSAEQAQKVCPIVGPLPQPACLLLQVHDSLLAECPKEMVPQVVETITAVMTQPWPELSGFSIPIEVKTGPSWGETVPYGK